MKEEASFCELYLEPYFFSEPSFSCCYASLATSDAAFVTIKNNNTRMQQHFSGPQLLVMSLTVCTLGQRFIRWN